MSRFSRNQRRRHHLGIMFRRQDGKCFWCEKPMKLEPQKRGAKPDPDIATTDHLDDRYSQERGTHGYGSHRTVAACWQCNNDRSREATAKIDKSILHWASGRFPSSARPSPSSEE